MKRKALLMVDVQNDFCAGGALAVPQGEEVVSRLNLMINYALRHGWLIFISRDWHPKTTKHFDCWPVHCVRNTEGAKFHPDLITDYAVIISKGLKSDENAYSAFDGFSEESKTIEELLKQNDIEEIYLGGLATDYCVKASAIDAANKGFKTFLLLDACRAVNLNPDDEDKAIEEMKSAGVIITTIEEVMK